MNFLSEFDSRTISFFRKIEVPFARIALFVVYFWFGLLKLLGARPAEPLVSELFQKTLSFMSFDVFYAVFALFEMIIGILFLIRGCERFAIIFLGMHIVMTTLPLIVLPHAVWSAFLVPTLTGQYIIKNILIVASAVVVGSTIRSKKT